MGDELARSAMSRGTIQGLSDVPLGAILGEGAVEIGR